MTNNSSLREEYFLGLDVGSVSVKLALLDISGKVLETSYVRHQGRPYETALNVLKNLTQKYPPHLLHPPKVTGIASTKLAGLLGGEPLGEIMALTLAAQATHREAKSLIDIGGEDTKLLWFKNENGLFSLADFAMNALCAAGTGSFLDQQAHRLNYDITEFGNLSLKSTVPPRVAGRCSVFAKSDMIHLQQSATPDYEIIYGLCLAMARSLKSGLAKGKSLAPPVLFVGGVAANPGLGRALREILKLGETGLIIPPTHFVFGAYGAAWGALTEFQSQDIIGFDITPLENWLKSPHEPPSLEAPLVRRAKTPQLATFDWGTVSAAKPLPVYVGVDVGSVSTNVALVTEDGLLVDRQYLPTAGRPLEAINRGFNQIAPEVKEKTRVLGACATGSGRYLTADYLGADITVNEITAQATAAVTIDPQVDTIFEIGGQDSKYISLKDGVIVDFMMNKACAAGTGSFLEEQADKLGLSIKGEFGDLALASVSPVRLGERCTVFMESDLVHHQQNGVDLKDLAAGLCHGIVANYLGRVVETRHVGTNIFFQGGTSFNEGVAAAFESRLGRPITVPDNADVTGAMGAALIARDRRTWQESSFVGYDLSKRPYEITSFFCTHCANHCEIRKVTVASGSPFFYGSRCDRYEEETPRKKLRPPLPDLFQFREQAVFNPPELQTLPYGKNPDQMPYRGKVGLIRSMFFAELGPFFAVFLAALGFEPVWSRPTNKTTIHQGCERVQGEFCFPIKAAHGHLLDLLEKDLDHIFLPSIVNMPAAPPINGGTRAPDNACCPYAQSLAFTAPAALDLHEPFLVRGPIFFGEGPQALTDSLILIGKKLKASRGDVLRALERARSAQENFSNTLIKKGTEVLATLLPQDMAMVVVGRPYNGFDPGLNLRLSEKMADLGILAIPMDFLPLLGLGEEPLSHYWRYGQKITSAGNLIASSPNLEALYISNFGCGPDSFITHFFKNLLGPKPFLEIEIDEHSSDVGAVTRLEAFLDSLEARKARSSKRGETAPDNYSSKLSVIRGPKPGATIFIPPMCDHTRPLAAALRGAGLEAVALPNSDAQTIELGRSQTSGKECYPLILTVGDFLKLTQTPNFEPHKTALFMPSSNGPCRFGQYSRYLSLVLKRLGLSEVEVLSLDQTGSMYEYLDKAGPSGTSLSKTIWRALVSVDLLQKALYHTRPREKSRGAANLAYSESLTELETIFENGSFRDLKRALKSARDRFSAARGDPSVLPQVGLVGEIYVRNNDFANEFVIRRLEDLGAEVVIPPFTEWIFYTGFVNNMRAKRSKDYQKRLKTFLTHVVQDYELKKIYKTFQGFFPHKLVDPPVGEVIELGEHFLHRAFQGEAILSLGKAYEFYFHGASGVVNIMPFTCMPGMVVGGLSANFREKAGHMPLLSLAFDGQSQTNTQARLEAFMFQARSFNNPHFV
ncbi:MAG: acyl-CoA dehydratase activase [Deltaproteobacteria bacterium]|jgi:predicted CoA-substrate-specific enzyme activase|nr:acyl-CoA dehydratase activase [Deltaproteobacteria bacterium]